MKLLRYLDGNGQSSQVDVIFQATDTTLQLHHFANNIHIEKALLLIGEWLT